MFYNGEMMSQMSVVQIYKLNEELAQQKKRNEDNEKNTFNCKSILSLLRNHAKSSRRDMATRRHGCNVDENKVDETLSDIILHVESFSWVYCC